MALLECRFFSEVLGIESTFFAIVPVQPHREFKQSSGSAAGPYPQYPVLYLLHGLGDDHSVWIRRTRIEEYAAAYGIAVVIPAVGRTFYTDMDRGGRYWTFISEELPYAARSLLPLSEQREASFAAGVSMGGYGAFKLALSHPDRFAAAASLSGSLHVALRADPNWQEFVNIFGDPRSIAGSPNDLFYLAEQAARCGQPLPQLYQCCGTDDFLYEHNCLFRDHANGLGLPLTYEEEKESHNWTYWDRQIARVLEWLPLRRNLS